MRRETVSLFLVGALALVGCGGGSDAEQISALQDQIASLESENSDHSETIAELEAQVGELETARDDAQTELEAIASDRETLRTDLNTASEELEATKAELSQANEDLAAANATAEELRQTYDPEIRADLEEEVAAEIERACAVAEEDVDTPIGKIVDFKPVWEPVTSKTALVTEVEECSAETRRKTLEERETERFADCETIEIDQIEKNPDSLAGDCVELYAMVFQFDAATGPCYFLANIADDDYQDWFEYETTSAFGTTSDEVESSLTTDCPMLDDIDVDDYVHVYATVLGSYSYETAIGGNNTVPSFRIEKIELVRKG